jgi:hypothetical protein
VHLSFSHIVISNCSPRVEKYSELISKAYPWYVAQELLKPRSLETLCVDNPYDHFIPRVLRDRSHHSKYEVDQTDALSETEFISCDTEVLNNRSDRNMELLRARARHLWKKRAGVILRYYV